MKKRPSALSLLAMLGLLFSLASCSSKSKEANSLNLDFEKGDLSFWNVISGEGFSAKRKEAGDNSEGNYYLSSGADNETGSLTSSPFVLADNGKISFLYKDGNDHDNIAISLKRYIDDSSVYSSPAYLSSSSFSRAIIYAPSASKEEVYLSILDASTTASIALDDFLNGGTEGLLLDENQISSSYEKEHFSSLNKRYRHDYHAMPSIGWCNDPNGFIFYNGKAHLFFQHHPYSSSWGPMHWGHLTSSDFVKWEDEGNAISPEENYDKDGCFSGSALEIDGKMYLMYTSVNGAQEQSMAFSDDGKNFKKYENNPVIGSSVLPEGISSSDFRDPALLQKEGKVYAIMGARDESQNMGTLLLYEAKDIQSPFSYVGKLFENDWTPGVYECPDIEEIGGQELLIISPQKIRSSRQDEYQNDHSSVYSLGSINLNNGEWDDNKGTLSFEEFDKGFDFYAPQVTRHGNTLILTAWMNGWGRSYPTQKDGWAGAMVLPRELSLIDGHVYQKPIKAIKSYRKNGVSLSSLNVTSSSLIPSLSGNCKEISFSLDVNSMTSSKAGIKLLSGENEHTDIYYDKSLGMVVFDRQNGGEDISEDNDPGTKGIRFAKVEPVNGKINFDIFLDVSSIEAFINDGYLTMSGLSYPVETSYNNIFFADGGSTSFLDINSYNLDI